MVCVSIEQHTMMAAMLWQDDAGQGRGMGTVEFQYPEDALQAISRLTNTVSHRKCFAVVRCRLLGFMCTFHLT